MSQHVSSTLLVQADRVHLVADYRFLVVEIQSWYSARLVVVTFIQLVYKGSSWRLYYHHDFLGW